MLNRIYAALAALFLLTASAHGAGTVPGFSLTPQFDKTGKVAIGCKAYTIQAGTTATPQNSYQDSALTIPQPNPIPCDSAGRLPQFFLADGQIKIRVVDKNGSEIFVGDNLLVIGPSSGGGGGGGTIDPTTIAATGDMKVAYGTSILSGWVRANGRTIGSATSGASERANADVQALFVYLWGADVNLAVSGGRGASAAADWSANKTITLPDLRGRVLAGLDDMGNSAAGRLTAGFFASPTTLGAPGGSQSQTLATANLPPYTPAGSISNGQTIVLWSVDGYQPPGGGSRNAVNDIGTGKPNAAAFPVTGMSFTGTPQGGTSSAFSVLQPTLLATYYLKI